MGTVIMRCNSFYNFPMKRKRLILEVAGTVDIEKITIDDIQTVGENVGEVVNIQLGEDHLSELHPIKYPRGDYARNNGIWQQK